MEVPANQQEVLYLETDIFGMQNKVTAKEYIEKMEEALHYTMPILPLEKWNMWVFQREEAIIVGNMATKLLELGEGEWAEEMFFKVLHSLEKQMERTQIPYRGYIVITTGLINVLGEHKKYRQSMQQDEKIMKVLLNDTIENIDFFLYDICWSLYELAKEQSDRKQEYQQWWKKLFLIVYQLANFFYKETGVEFYKRRKEKYLQEELQSH